MGFFDFIFGKKKNKPQNLSYSCSTSTQSRTKSTTCTTGIPKIELKEKTASTQLSIKEIAMGFPFRFTFNVSVVKQYYNQTSEQVNLNVKVTASMIRTVYNGNIMINFSDLEALKSKGIIQTNLSLTPNFSYNLDTDGDEFASAEINNSWAAISSGKEYVSLFQITKQKGNIVSFIINNLPGDQDYYYLIMFRQ